MPNRFDTFEPADEDLGPFAPPVRKKPAGAGISTEKPTSPWEHFLLAMAMGPRPYAQTLLQTRLGEKALRRKYELERETRETPEEREARIRREATIRGEVREGFKKPPTPKQEFMNEYYTLAKKLDKTDEEKARFEELENIKRRTGGFQLLLPEDLNRLK